MTEPDNEPVFDPATDADAPAEEAASDTMNEVSEDPSVAVLLETTEEEPAPEPTTPVVNPEPVEVSPDAPELDSPPVSGDVSDSSAVSDAENVVQPDYSDTPENTKAEPNNAETTHEATPGQVEVQE